MIYFGKITAFDKVMFCIIPFMYTSTMRGLTLSYTMSRWINIFFLILILYYCIAYHKSLFNFNDKNIDKDIRIAITLLLVWNTLTVMRGLAKQITEGGVHVSLLMQCTYFVPLACFLIITQEHIKKTIIWGMFWVLIAMVITWVNRRYLLVGSLAELAKYYIGNDETIFQYYNFAQLISASFGGVAFYLIYNETKSKTTLFLWSALIIGVISSALMGRRSSAATLLLYACLFVVYKLRYKTRYLVIFIILSIAFIGIYRTHAREIESAFPVLFNRLTDDTRSGVETDYYKDMDFTSYIFGRGSNGLIYSSDWGRRAGIETGYLDMILHGGIIQLGLYLYILIIALIRGFFAKNKLSVAMSLYILARILLLYPGGHMRIDYNTIALFICVAYCSNKKIRNSNFSIKV